MLYRLVRPLLFRLPPETAHHVAFGALRAMQRWPAALAWTRRVCLPTADVLRTEALGLTFPHPIGLAAGFDKDAVAYEALGALGFGHVEVGTITGRPQPGNPKPRLFRVPADRALLNRMGFNNGGSAAAVERLARPRRTLVGVNIGKTKVVSEAQAIEDYVLSARRLGPYADYIVVNVSSPNTPGLRDLQAVARLRPLLGAVRRELDAVTSRRVALLVKIAPDLADDEVDAVADLALEEGLDGIVATNTTIARTGLRTPTNEVARIGPGGLSGAPLKMRAEAVLRRLYRRVGPKVTLIGVGGLETVDDAWDRIRAGASLLQLYTAFVYGGPGLVRMLALGLAERAKAHGFARVQDAVGTRV